MAQTNRQPIIIETLRKQDYLVEVLPYEMDATDVSGKLVYEIGIRSSSGRRGHVRVPFESHGAQVIAHLMRDSETIAVEANNVDWMD